jgi:hypothetical protein
VGKKAGELWSVPLEPKWHRDQNTLCHILARQMLSHAEVVVVVVVVVVVTVVVVVVVIVVVVVVW